MDEKKSQAVFSANSLIFGKFGNPHVSLGLPGKAAG
jgi:hypothetical protein